MGWIESHRGGACALRARRAAAGLVLLGLAGCGGGGGDSGSSSNEATPLEGNLRVTGHQPAAEAIQVPTDAAIQLSFDAPIHQGSVASGQITLCSGDGAPLLGTFAMSAGQKSVTFTPSEPLLESCDYTLTVAPLVYDTHFRTLSRPYVFRFRSLDTEPPRVVSHTPGQGTQGIAPNLALAVLFSEAMAPSSVSSATVKLRDWNGYDVACRVRLEGARILIQPLTDLRGNRNYTLSVRGGAQGVQDRSGNPLVEDLRVGFATARDETGPAFLGSLPGPGGDGLAPSGVIRVSFDDSIDPWSVEPTAVLLVDELGGSIPLGLLWSEDRRSVALIPQVSLAPGLVHLVAFPGGLGGLANMSAVNLGTGINLGVRTGSDDDPFTVESLSPADQEVLVGVNAVPEIQFSRPVLPASLGDECVQILHEGLPLAAAAELSQDGLTLRLRPAAHLPAAARCRVVLKGGPFGLLADNYRHLAADVAAEFTTTDDDEVPSVFLYPSNGTGQVARNSTFVALFSEPVKSDTATSATVQLIDLSSGAPLPGNLSLELEGRAVRFAPAGALTPGQHLCFKVAGGNAGVKDRQGNWLSDTAQAALLVGYHQDTTPPVTYLTLNEIPESLGTGLNLAPFGFTLDISGYDPGDAAIDPTSLALAIAGEGNRYPTFAELAPRVCLKSQGELSLRIPPSLALGTGRVTFRVSLADLSGNRSAEALASAEVAALTDGARPLERNQLIFVDFTTDREGKGRGDGTADWYQDLLDYGLVSAGDPIGRNGFLMQTIQDGVLSKANRLFGRGSDGTPREGSIAVLFVGKRPPAGIPCMQMAMGGQDPEGGKRALGQESTGVLGRAWFDLKNSNFATNNTGTSPGLGVFPGELFLYQANLYQALYPGYITTFGRRFRLLSPHLGGTPAGSHPEDAVALAPEFDFTQATAAQRSRYLAVFEAADDLAVALGALLAHETGHSLGLVAPGAPPEGLWGDASLHNHYGQPQDLMNAVVGYDALIEELYQFRALNRAYLREQILLR